MSEAQFIASGMVALSVALAGALASSVGAAGDARRALAQRRARRDEARAWEQSRAQAQAIDGVKTDLMVMELEIKQDQEVRNYRHNLHCPRCGRFARRIFPGENAAVSCSVHAVQVRWMDIPVEWGKTVAAVAQGVTVTTAPVQIVEPREFLPIVLGELTEPIDIVEAPATLELEEMGARL